MHHPTDRIAHTTSFVAPVVEHWLVREIDQWEYPMKDRSDDPSHDERTLLPRSYISFQAHHEYIHHNFNVLYSLVYMSKIPTSRDVSLHPHEHPINLPL